ncbi:MAG: PAS domain S-box protein [Bacillus sp. (in: Bacteria)]|nr:PAS domain S-box protein [Bacillus sp. (in: firmicutes)]
MDVMELGYDQEKDKLLHEIDQLKIENEKLKSELSTTKEISKYLNESEQRFEQLFNNISDAVYYLKIDKEGVSGNFIEVNKIAYKRLGYTREEMLNMSPFDIDYHEREELIQILESIMNTETLIFETMHVCKDGTLIPVEIKTHNVVMDGETFTLSVCRDISERKQAERVIRDTKKQYQRLVESSTNGIAVLQDDKWVFANEAALKLFGAHTKDQLLGKSIYDMLYPEFIEKYKILTKFGGKHARLNSTWKNLDGREIHTEIVSIPIIFRDRVAKQLIIQDVTERKQAEDLMIQAEKMNVVGQLAAGIAHEIRNPLTSLKGFVQLFRSGTVPNDKFLNIMESELERIDVISSEFLTLAKPYNVDFSPVDIQELLKNVIALLGTEASKQRISIDTSFLNETIIVDGVNAELKKVFINLIKNAIEVMPDGGTIKIIVENSEEAVDISIQDHGIGMTDEQLRRLGEPFFTTKETGTGLGLMVTYKIIDHHHGEMKVKSKLNEGTTFTVRLPVIT